MPNLGGIWFRDPARRNRSGIVEFEGKVPLGAAGAIGTSYVAGTMTPGFTVSKVAATTGRYKVQLNDQSGAAIVYGGDQAGPILVTIQTNAASAAYTAGKANAAIQRTPASNGTPATDGTISLQLIRADTNADAEAEDSATLWIRFTVKVTTAKP